MKFADEFNTAVHHGDFDVTEFEATVRAFEDFVADRLIPPTFTKRDRIAQLVREAESDAADN
jgi:hypothetical protein